MINYSWLFKKANIVKYDENSHQFYFFPFFNNFKKNLFFAYYAFENFHPLPFSDAIGNVDDEIFSNSGQADFSIWISANMKNLFCSNFIKIEIPNVEKIFSNVESSN